MRTPVPVADPWAADIDNGWHDLIVSSAPPPPPPAALREPAPEPAAVVPRFLGGRELATREIQLKNQPLPSDLNTWQEHGAARPAAAEANVEEPSFNRSDRRMWLIAGSLMGLAALVLGVLGVISFGGPRFVGALTPAAPPHTPPARVRAEPIMVAAPLPATATPTSSAPPARSVELPEPAGVGTLTTAAHGKKHHSHHKKQPLASR
jgi:hypothetical protein